jgi:hypothetical protein|nr:MAG TPA: tail collar fiber protein [Caudoviricetes sp.]
MNTNNVINVDIDTRKVTVPLDFSLGAVNDDSIKTLSFRVQKNSAFSDVSDLTFSINTISALGTPDRLECTITEEDNTMLVTAVLKGTVFEAQGRAIVNLCGRKFDSKGNVIKKWGSEDAYVLVRAHTDAEKALETNCPTILQEINGKIKDLDMDVKSLKEFEKKITDMGVYSKSQIDEMIKAIVVPTKLSELTDDSTHRLTTDTEKTKWNAKSDFSGSYNDLTNKPVIPSKLAQMTEDADHRLTSDADKNKWNAKSDFSGSYNDLTNKPSIPSKLSQMTEDATHRVVTDADKTRWDNKSDFNGSYNSLNDKPTIPLTLAEMTDDESHRVVTDSEKTTWNSKVDDKDIEPIKGGITDLRASLGLIDDVLGLTVDYKNKTCTRIGGAKNLNAGTDFDPFIMYGGRKRCNVADDGTINAYYGDEGYIEDGSNGQVMVYQPKFYYMVCPLVIDKQESGLGYHLRKANYYISDKPKDGFKVHPAFYNEDGQEVDYVLMSAFEGSIYDTSANAYLLGDEQVMKETEDKFSSIAGARPASGYKQNLTRPNVEAMAKNRGLGWHSLGIKIASMEQLLMMIELGTMNTQTGIGQGVIGVPWETEPDKTCSYAAATGSTSALGNGTGQATETVTYNGGVATTNTNNGLTSISYRGVENFWGNIWKFVYGVNFYYKAGEPFVGYICKDFNYAESKKDGNYESIGFSCPSKNGYISAMGYSENCDWVFFPSEVEGNSSVPVGDYYYQNNTWEGYRIAPLGGDWTRGSAAGGFCWSLADGVGTRDRTVGARLVYVPH